MKYILMAGVLMLAFLVSLGHPIIGLTIMVLGLGWVDARDRRIEKEERDRRTRDLLSRIRVGDPADPNGGLTIAEWEAREGARNSMKGRDP